MGGDARNRWNEFDDNLDSMLSDINDDPDFVAKAKMYKERAAVKRKEPEESTLPEAQRPRV